MTKQKTAVPETMNIKIPTPLHEQVKALAKKDGRLISWIVANAVREYVTSMKERTTLKSEI